MSFLLRPPDPKREDKVPFHHLARCNRDVHPKEVVKFIQIVYIFAVIVWIIVVYYLRLFDYGIVGWIVILAPLFVFAISYHAVTKHTTDLEKEMFGGNYLSFAFLIVAILINWTAGDKRYIYQILLVALVFLVISLVDIWIRKEYLIVFKHVRTTLQTMSLVLLIYSLYIFYIQIIKHKDTHGK